MFWSLCYLALRCLLQLVLLRPRSEGSTRGSTKRRSCSGTSTVCGNSKATRPSVGGCSQRSSIASGKTAARSLLARRRETRRGVKSGTGLEPATSCRDRLIPVVKQVRLVESNGARLPVRRAVRPTTSEK